MAVFSDVGLAACVVPDEAPVGAFLVGAFLVGAFLVGAFLVTVEQPS